MKRDENETLKLELDKILQKGKFFGHQVSQSDDSYLMTHLSYICHGTQSARRSRYPSKSNVKQVGPIKTVFQLIYSPIRRNSTILDNGNYKQARNKKVLIFAPLQNEEKVMKKFIRKRDKQRWICVSRDGFCAGLICVKIMRNDSYAMTSPSNDDSLTMIHHYNTI